MIPKYILTNPAKCPKFDIRCGLSKFGLQRCLTLKDTLLREWGMPHNYQRFLVGKNEKPKK